MVPMLNFETVFMGYLRVKVVFRSTDPDLGEDEVIPGLERSREPGINRALSESGQKEYRA
jgi:hypothetical protein